MLTGLWLSRPAVRWTAALLLIGGGTLAACSRGGSPDRTASPPSVGDSGAPPSAPSPSPGEPAPRIRISPERQQQIGVKFAEAALLPALVELRVVGRVAYDETQIAHVHTKVSGWIEDVFVDYVGASVRKGQPLFTIYSPELVSSQEEYLLARRAQEELGASALPRVAEGSRALLASARRRLELWDLTPAQIEALEKEGRVSRAVTVVSQVDGVVTEREVYHHGRTVTPEMDLYTIVDLSRVWVQAAVYESEAPLLKVGQTAEVSLPYALEPRRLRGRIAFVSPFVDPATRTIQIRTEFPNQDLSLRPGAFVDVVLRRDLGQRIVVPKDAVIDTGASQYSFVDKGDGYLDPRLVKAGPEVALGRVISEGLRPGERVVTAANFIVDSESRLKGALDALGRPGGAEAPTAAPPGVSAQVTTDPSPARVGKNQLRVLVRDASGAPLSGAEVEIRFFMPAMVGMAQVDIRARLRGEGGGVYSGQVELPIAWSFATTVTVRRDGAVLGTAETTLTSR